MISDNMSRTGFPSKDKPWQKYYTKEALQATVPECTMYDYIYNRNYAVSDKIAIDYYGNKISYALLFKKIKRTAEAFASFGIRKHDVVTIQTLMIPEAIYCIYALNYIGAVANLVYMSLSEEELLQTIDHTKSKMLIVLAGFNDNLNKICETVDIEVVQLNVADSLPLMKKLMYKNHRTSEKSKVTLFSNLIRKKHVTVGKVAYEKNMPAIIVYTSGTTGQPKGALLSNENINAITLQYIHMGYDDRDGDSILTFIPPFLSLGLSLNLHMPLVLGLKSMICTNPETMNVVKAFIKRKPNYFLAAPFTVMEITKQMKHPMKWCKSFGGGGESLTIEQEKLVNEFLSDHHCEARYSTGYGMTEFAGTVTTENNHTNKPGTLGIPLCKTIVKVVNPDTLDELRYNEVGELCFHTPSQMIGYLNNESATNNMIRTHSDGMKWLHTGDLGSVDEDGFVYFKGRIKRIYMTKGEDGTIYKIFPARVEELLMKHPKLGKCAVCVREDQERIHVQIAYITLRENVKYTDDLMREIKEYCCMNLPTHVHPYQYVVMDKIPILENGKVDYSRLEFI